ncbi:MAG: hypothetical protein WD939_00605 [Dehalococcoidia bacterium]
MHRTPLRGVLPITVAAIAVAIALAAPSRAAFAFPPAATDVLDVSATVSVTSRLGSETFPLTGTVEIARSDPYIDGGVSVVDLEIVALNLTGQSVTGGVGVSESAALASAGEIRSQQPGLDYPADAFLDAFIVVIAPASPSPTITLHNSAALRMTPSFGGNPIQTSAWPPAYPLTLDADTSPCVPLLPVNPMGACVTNLSVTFGETPDPGGAVGGFTELSPPVASASERALRFPIAIGAAIAGFVLFAVTSWWRARSRS